MLRLRLISLVSVSLLLTVPASSAASAESDVKVAPEVMGTLSPGSAITPKAAVLLLHGWTGHRDEVGDLDSTNDTDCQTNVRC